MFNVFRHSCQSVDVLNRFKHLKLLNLADNDLRTFPLSICAISTLTQLNLASNKLSSIPPDISKFKQLVNVFYFYRMRFL